MARSRYQSFFVVEKGDTLSSIASQIYTHVLTLGMSGTPSFTTGVGGLGCYFAVYLASNQVGEQRTNMLGDFTGYLLYRGNTNKVALETR